MLGESLTAIGTKANARNASIDILRVLAMIGIIVFHHFGPKIANSFIQLPPGFTNESSYYDIINNASGYIQKTSLISDFCYAHFGYGCNYIFMLVTGFFLFGKHSSFQKRTNTAVKVVFALVFYGIVLTLISLAMLVIVRPQIDTMPTTPLLELPNWLSGSNMWYLQAYGVFILVVLPLLKLFEDKLTKEVHASICIGLVCIHLFNYRAFLPALPLADTIIFFIMCYYIGGYVRKYDLRLSLKQLILLLVLYSAAYLGYDYYWRYSNMILFSPHEYSYVKAMLPMQPFICTITFAFLCFSIATKIRIKPSEKLSKALGSLSSSTIGIYIFHMGIIHYAFIVANWLWWHDWSTKGFLCFVILDTLLLFIASYAIELLRKRLMNWLYSKFERPAQKLPANQTASTMAHEN